MPPPSVMCVQNPRTSGRRNAHRSNPAPSHGFGTIIRTIAGHGYGRHGSSVGSAGTTGPGPSNGSRSTSAAITATYRASSFPSLPGAYTCTSSATVAARAYGPAGSSNRAAQSTAAARYDPYRAQPPPPSRRSFRANGFLNVASSP